MLIKNSINKKCNQSFVDGECCCNCKHRYVSMVDNFPLGWFCGHPVFEGDIHFISFEGHSMCEMHERV